MDDDPIPTLIVSQIGTGRGAPEAPEEVLPPLVAFLNEGLTVTQGH